MIKDLEYGFDQKTNGEHKGQKGLGMTPYFKPCPKSILQCAVVCERETYVTQKCQKEMGATVQPIINIRWQSGQTATPPRRCMQRNANCFGHHAPDGHIPKSTTHTGPTSSWWTSTGCRSCTKNAMCTKKVHREKQQLRHTARVDQLVAHE